MEGAGDWGVTSGIFFSCTLSLASAASLPCTDGVYLGKAKSTNKVGTNIDKSPTAPTPKPTRPAPLALSLAAGKTSGRDCFRIHGSDCGTTKSEQSAH